MRMFDGVVMTLTGVRHIPSIRRNLISLGAFDAKGYRCTSEGGVMKITKGASVEMEGKKVRILLVLVGTTIKVTSSGKRVWCKILGQRAYNQGDLELSKRGR